MTIAFRASSTTWTSGVLSVAPALPIGTTTGDMMVLYVGCKPFDATIVTPSGWTLLAAGSGNNGSTAMGIDTGSVLWATFYREWLSGDAAPTVSITSGNSSLGVIFSFSKSAATWATPVAAKGSDTSSGTDLTLTMDVDLGITTNDMLFTCSTIAGNNAGYNALSVTATSATLDAAANILVGSTTSGNDLASAAGTSLCSTGTATAAPACAWTLSLAQTGGGSIVRLREAVNAPILNLLNMAPYLAADARS